MIDYAQIDHSWTLFLDRDGVINVERPQQYILSPDELVLEPGVDEVLTRLSDYFKYIIIVTNQRCISRGWLTEQGLVEIHETLLTLIGEGESKIDAIYHAPGGEEDPLRKPSTGMGVQAQSDFPDIDFTKSIMIGNNISDMEFGKNLGTKTVLLTTTREAPQPLPDSVDEVCDNLYDWYSRHESVWSSSAKQAGGNKVKK